MKTNTVKRLAFVALAALGLAVSACSGPGFSGKDSSNKSDEKETQPEKENEELANKQPAETGKPSEDTEGVPGYLVDPAMVEVTVNGKSVVIAGSSDSIKKPEGADKTAVAVQVTTASALAEAGKNGGKLVAPIVGSSILFGNGFSSFSMSVGVEAGDVVVLSVGSELPTEGVTVPPAGEGLTSALVGTFDGSTLPLETLHADP